MIIPKSDKTLMVTPNCAAKTNIPKNATGNPKATQIANLKFKNNARKNNTNKMPEIAFLVKSQVLSFKVILLSLVTLN